MPIWIHPDAEREVRRLAAKGHKLREIGRPLGYSRHVEPLPFGPAVWRPATGRLSLDEREEIRVGLKRGDTFTAIAVSLGRGRVDRLAGAERERVVDFGLQMSPDQTPIAG